MRTPHYLTPLRTTRIPAVHIAFDCETRLVKSHGRTSQKWVCGAAALGELAPDGVWGNDHAVPFHNAERMWSWILGLCPHHATSVIWAHNLAFDLRVSEALRWLPAAGFDLEAVVLEKTATWASFKSENRTLTLCDLHSWCPVPLARVAADLGYSRKPLTYTTASDKELERHCCEDVEFTIEAVGRLVEYLDSNDMGRFRPTGSGMSHAAWRRKWLPDRQLLIHGDTQALERERTAMWTGRAEAWSWGEVTGPIYEHDLNLAYCRIAATSEVPVKLFHRTGKTSVERYMAEVEQRAILADVTVETDKEIVPTSEDGRVFWPVGRFSTTLWDPELTCLIRGGAKVIIHRTWHYRKAAILAPMANYLIEQLAKRDGTAHPVVQLMLKHWARALVGRCALRYREWEDYGTVPVMGLHLSTMYDTTSEKATELLQVGHRLMELSDMAEADSSVPQVTGWVMSAARRNLWALMQMAGLQNLHYVDTDCVIVNAHGHRNLNNLDVNIPAIELIHKATWSKATIWGPRNATLEGERRVAGVPRSAVATGPRQFNGDVWAGLRTSLESRHPNQVDVISRDFNMNDADPRRIHLTGGDTCPYNMENHA